MKRPKTFVSLQAALLGMAVAATAGEVQPAPVLNAVPAAQPVDPSQAEAAELQEKTGSYVSPWLMEVLKLSRAGVEEPVVQNYVDTAGTFNLTPELIIYARDSGVTAPVLSSMLQHDADLGKGLLPMPNPPPSSAILLRKVIPSRQNVPRVVTPKPEAVEGSDEEGLVPPVPPLDLDFPEPIPTRLQVRLASLNEKTVFAVRDPNPVRLTAPIYVYQGGFRRPNIQILELFPEGQ
jgi:hypothetical protein